MVSWSTLIAAPLRPMAFNASGFLRIISSDSVPKLLTMFFAVTKPIP